MPQSAPPPGRAASTWAPDRHRLMAAAPLLPLRTHPVCRLRALRQRRAAQHFGRRFAWDRALAAMLRVRADDRPSCSAFDAMRATFGLVTFDDLRSTASS